jgi:hypothetical protein
VFALSTGTSKFVKLSFIVGCSDTKLTQILLCTSDMFLALEHVTYDLSGVYELRQTKNRIVQNLG